MDQIPSAEEFLESSNNVNYNSIKDEVKKYFIAQDMSEFTKLHVKAALEAASKSQKFSSEGARGRVFYDVYPEDLIK